MMLRKTREIRPLCEPLEERLCLASSVGWDGPGRGSAALTYYIGDTPASLSLSRATVQAAIRTALDAWASVAAVTFTQTSQPNRADSLDFTFRRIDGAGGTLASGYFPDDVNSGRIAGDVQFDTSEDWEVGNALGAEAVDLVLTSVHEIGHALGLDHSSVPGSVMAPSVSPDTSFEGLGPSDVKAILALYAASNSTKAGTTGSSTGTTTGSSTGTTTDTPTHVLGVNSIRTKGRGKTAVVVSFSGPMDPGSVSNLGIYRLVAIGKGASSRPSRVRLASATYDEDSHTVTIKLRQPVKAATLCLTIYASGAVAASGVQLAGDNYVAIVRA